MFNRAGKQVGTVGPPGLCGSPVISPDGKRIAFDLDNGPNRDIWTAEIATGHVQRVTFDREVDHGPIWSPDGSRIAFDSHRSGLGDLVRQSCEPVPRQKAACSLGTIQLA